MESGTVYEIGWTGGVSALPKEVRLHDVLGQFPLPTEYVVTDLNKPVVPLMGRIYAIEGKGHSEMCAVELWLDMGEDGHTELRFAGVVIFRTKEILVSNDNSFMKTSSWLYDLTIEVYQSHYYEKLAADINKHKEAK